MREKKRDEKHSCRFDWLRTCDLENETCTRLISRTHIHKRAHPSLEIYTISRTHTHAHTHTNTSTLYTDIDTDPVAPPIFCYCSVCFPSFHARPPKKKNLLVFVVIVLPLFQEPAFTKRSRKADNVIRWKCWLYSGPAHDRWMFVLVI